jgi:hypothetical protein
MQSPLRLILLVPLLYVFGVLTVSSEGPDVTGDAAAASACEEFERILARVQKGPIGTSRIRAALDRVAQLARHSDDTQVRQSAWALWSAARHDLRGAGRHLLDLSRACEGYGSASSDPRHAAEPGP